MLTFDPVHAGSAERMGNSDLRVRLGRSAGESAVERIEVAADPWAPPNPVDRHGAHVVFGRSAVVHRLLDDGHEIAEPQRPSEIERGAGRRRDSDAVRSGDDVVGVDGCRSVRDDRRGCRCRLSSGWSDQMDATISRHPAEAVQPPCGRARDCDVRSCDTESRGSSQLGLGNARRSVCPSNDVDEGAIEFEVFDLAAAEAAVLELLDRGDAVLSVEQLVRRHREVRHGPLRDSEDSSEGVGAVDATATSHQTRCDDVDPVPNGRSSSQRWTPVRERQLLRRRLLSSLRRFFSPPLSESMPFAPILSSSASSSA